MTVIDRLRAALPGAELDEHASWRDRLPAVGPWGRGLLAGAATGLASALLLVAPAVLAWMVEPRATGSAWGAAGAGASLWLLAGGGHLTAGPVTISVVPLLGLVLLVVLARYGAREAIVGVSTDGAHWHGILPAPLASALGAWWGGYAAVVALAAWLATAGPMPLSVPSVLVPAGLVPLVAMLAALRPVLADDPDVLGPRLGAARLPDAFRRGLRPGLAGAGVLLAVGAALVLALVGLSWGEVTRVHAALGAGGLGSVLLVLAQAAALPNLALWAVSFLAGPGFQVVEGASTTWAGSTSGLMPLVPVLAALPQPGDHPWFTPASALVVVAVGAWVGRRSLDAVARLSRLRTKASVAGAACLVSALTLGLLDLLAGGSLGQFRLASVGAPTLWLTLSVLGLMELGAMVVVVRDAWRLRR